VTIPEYDEECNCDACKEDRETRKPIWVKVMEYRHIRNKQLEKAKKEYFEVHT